MAKKKKKRVLKIKNIVICFIILLGIIGIFYYALTMPVHNIYIKGNNIVKDDEIIKLAGLEEYPPFLFVKKKELISKIKKNPYINEISIDKKLGNIISINLKEFQIIALDKQNKVILSNGKKLDNTYELSDVPVLINDISDKKIYQDFTKKFSKIDSNILRQISEIEYSPVEVDEKRFLLYMSDKNLVYVTLTKINKINKYNGIKDKIGDKKGIIYLDAGDYMEVNNN